tara:strand:+ start:129 stop:377 length:249 start_codon:yes stop_codon:yes gene_type:complete
MQSSTSNFFYTVIEDAPVYTSKRYGRWQPFVRNMKVNDSFRVQTFQEGESARNAFRKEGKTVTIRKRTTHNGIDFWQIWRIT